MPEERTLGLEDWNFPSHHPTSREGRWAKQSPVAYDLIIRAFIMKAPEKTHQRGERKREGRCWRLGAAGRGNAWILADANDKLYVV